MKHCEKCGYESDENKKVLIDEEEKYLCSICNQFAPSKEKLKDYFEDKIDWKHLESYRKYAKKTTSGMEIKAKEGRIVSRAPFGYKLVNKELVIDEDKKIILQDIFQTFLNSDISLNQLSIKYKISVNGLKKVLRNFTYIGKVKFAGQILQGKHTPLISPELFNKVQSKLESLGIK